MYGYTEGSRDVDGTIGDPEYVDDTSLDGILYILGNFIIQGDLEFNEVLEICTIFPELLNYDSLLFIDIVKQHRSEGCSLISLLELIQDKYELYNYCTRVNNDVNYFILNLETICKGKRSGYLAHGSKKNYANK
jgi:hypothetical protein